MDAKIFDIKLLFCGFSDFIAKRNTIKETLITKSDVDQYIYKLYLYSRPVISDSHKDYMWDYLQSDISEFDFMAYALHTLRKKLNIC